MKQKILKCQYCGRTAVLRPATYVYGDKAIEEHVYVCSGYPVCNSYVGVHKGTLKPKGTLANGDLRNLRIHAHKLFSHFWTCGLMSKKEAYRWMRYKFALTEEQAHIGNFSEYMCTQFMDECRKVLANNRIAS
ncbi:MAG: DUF3268 family zinc-finger domain-containing protein [Oscillospiraceae bacterium]|jgi:hypothetical protein|nr:DUF3268 family zinc-finger domain-containing protein [Oscillospiraceae bacterium]